MGNKIDISARNDKATTKMLRLNVLSTQVTKTVDEQNELSSLQNELSDYIISANDINAIAQASDLTTTNNNIGTLSSLTTNDKTSLVSAANEVETRALITRSLQREIAQLKLVSSIKNRVNGASNIFYDDFSGSVAGSIAQLDTYKSNFTGALSVGATSGTVTSAVGLSIGREVTIQDVTTEATRERVIISNIVGSVVSFATPLANSYASQAQIYRSIGLVDTVNKRLKFGGASYSTTYTNTNKTVVASAYDTSGNGGRKIVLLSNGWLVSGVLNGTNTYYYVSKDSGASWNQLCFINSGTNSFAIISYGTMVYIAVAWSSNAYLLGYKFDAVTVANTNQSGSQFIIDSGQTSMGSGCSLAVDSLGTLHATWCSKNGTYPNSFNIRYSKSTDGGVTWATPTQLTLQNTAGVDSANPSIVIRSDNNPVIVLQQLNTSNYIQAYFFNGSAWTERTIYSVATYTQSNPCAIVKQNGSNIGRIVCRWQGLDATDTTKYNERWSYSDDGGATWSAAVKITSGNTVDRKSGSLSEDSNGNIFDTYMDGTSIVYQSCPNGTITFGTLTTLNATGSNPSSLERSNFTVPPTVYMSGSTVKFSGTYTATAILSLTQEDNRYNITPSSSMKSIVQWVDRIILTGFSSTSLASIVASGANEAFVSMTKKTTTIDGLTEEDQFSYTASSANTNITIRNTMNRASTSDIVYETQMSGAVSL